MKITIVMGFFLPVPALAGGATEKIWHRLGELMADAGHDVTLVSRRWPGLPERETLGRLTHLRLPGMNHTRRLPLNLGLDFLWGLRVLRALPRGDIVVCNTVTLPIFLRLLKPSAGRVAVVLGRMPKGQIRAYGAVDRLLATSTAVADQARRENPRLAPRIFRFPNPVDWRALADQSASPKNAVAHVAIGYVGRLHPEKGLELLLRAAALLARRPSLPAWRLRLVGPQTVAQGGGGEDYVASLRDLARQAGADVTVEPPVYDPAQLAAVYRSLDIFCYPSLAEKGEGLSIAPIEAMSAGAVPIVSALDCYADLIRHNANGLIFDHRAADAPEKLADALALLLADADLRHRLGQQARLDARPFDYESVARVLLDEFQSLLSPLAPAQTNR